MMKAAAAVAAAAVVAVVSLSVWRQSCIDGSTLVVGSDDAGGRAKSVPGEGLRDEEVAEFAERQHRTAEYQAKSSANIAEQRERWVRLLRLDVRRLHLREKYLHRNVLLQLPTPSE